MHLYAMDAQLRMVNRLAQGLRTPEQGLAWFTALDEEQRREVLRKLALCCDQARAGVGTGVGAGAGDVAEAVRRAGIRPTHTPAVMLARDVRRTAAVAELPADERVKAFRLLTALFAVADERRRARQCVGGCTHPWHNLPEQEEN